MLVKSFYLLDIDVLHVTMVKYKHSKIKWIKDLNELITKKMQMLMNMCTWTFNLNQTIINQIDRNLNEMKLFVIKLVN